jgi:AcrR family transcriptional regulator
LGVKERRTREKESLRQEILDAARELFIEEGYESVSMRRIAEKIEYSPTTIYLYFQDKAELLNSICGETFELLINRLEGIQGGVTDPILRVKAGLREYILFGLENPQHYRVTFMAPHMHPPEKFTDTLSAGMRAFAILQQCVSDCVEAGAFHPVDVNAVSQALWAGSHGVTSLLIAKEGFPFVERDTLINMVVDTMVKGLQA